MKRFFPLMLALTSCALPTPPTATPTQPTACSAPSLQGLVGQPATVLQTMRFGSEVRIIRPGTAVTMDYNENRLNIGIDANEKISRVYCG